MTASAYPNSSYLIRHVGHRWLMRGAPVSLPGLVYGLSVWSIVVSFYAFWAFWKLKLLYFGWTVAFIAAIVFGLSRDTKGLIRSFFPLIVWEGYIALSTLWAPDPAASQYFLTARIIFPMAFIIGYVWIRNVSMWHLSAFFPLMGMLLVPIVFWTYLTTGELYTGEQGSIRTGLAILVLSSVPFLVWRARNRPNWLRYTWIGVAILILAASGSRTGALLGATVLVGTLTFAQPPKGKKGRALTMSLFALVLLTGAGILIPQVRTGASESLDKLRTQTAFGWNAWTREEYFLTEAGETPADRDRRLQMLVVVRSFQTEPIRGNGYYSTFAITKEMLGFPIGAHGLVSLVLGEVGLIGALLFVWLMVGFFQGVGTAVKKAASAESRGFWETCRWTMIGMLLMGLFHQIDQTPDFYVLLAWGYAAGFPRAAPIAAVANGAVSQSGSPKSFLDHQTA